ncbi:MAG TPA: helix-turn-helix domain-containing protein [Alphaproteobacteria bacterium]|nr:helix-turn-helix domain-containing protein [Alphaproteobacteria bacterium]
MHSFTTARAGDDRIGALALSTGCPVETIRYYEKIGLLPQPLRTTGGHRVYGDGHKRRLAFVLRGRELGFSLEEIRELVALAEDGTGACQAAEAIARRHIGSIEARIADLSRMLEVLERLARACRRGRRPHCPILETLSDATKSGECPEGRRAPNRRAPEPR